MALYTVYSFLDTSPGRGGYAWAWKLGVSSMLRNGFFWRLSAAGRGPLTLIRSAPLPAEKGPYIFANHPHGIIGVAPMTNFGTSISGFEELFPKLRVHLLGASAIFRIPFFREWCLLHGHGTVERSCCKSLLEQGRCIALAPGGARESLESTPGTMRLILNRRKGFVKLALVTNSGLVPVLSFGENELYSTFQFKRGSIGRWCQRALKSVTGFTLPLFTGRFWFAPLVPKRGQVVSVVGEPIWPDRKYEETELTDAVVDAFHAKYCTKLRELFDKHKAENGMPDAQLELI